jgi:hypothetical protein
MYEIGEAEGNNMMVTVLIFTFWLHFYSYK